MKKQIENFLIIRKIIMSLVVILILTWAFFQNKSFGKIIISPFLVCSVAFLFENLFLLIKKEKISNIFRYIFSISFFIYVVGVLIYTLYYAIVNDSYSLLISVVISLLFVIHFIKLVFSKKINKNNKRTSKKLK